MFDFLLYVIAAFSAGVLTFVAPCTLPVLPAYLAYMTRSQEKKLTRNTLFFAFGLSSVFTAMGVFAGTVGRALLIYKREMVYVFAGLVLVFGLMSLFGRSIKLIKLNMKPKTSSFGSYVFGVFFGLTWTGCIGPVLGIMLVLAASLQTAFFGGLLLFVYGLGLMFPLFLLSNYVDRLPKGGRVWRLLRGKILKKKWFGKTFRFHTTNVVSGALFVFLGVFLLLEAQFKVTAFISPTLTDFAFSLQEKVVLFFGLR